MIFSSFFRRIAFLKNLYGDQKFNIAVLTALGFINGLLGSLGIGAMVPLFSFVAGGGHPGQDPISRTVFLFFERLNFVPSVSSLLVLVSTLFILKGVALAVFGYVALRIALAYEIGMRSSLYRRMLATNWSYLSGHKIGYLENTLMVDVTYAKNILKRVSSAILIATSFFMYLALAFSISGFITSVTIVTGALIVTVFLPLLKKTRRYSYKASMLKKEIANQINEHVIGAKTVKISGVESSINALVGGLFEKFRDISIRMYFIKDVPKDSFETVSMLFIALVFSVSYARPGFSFASFLVIMYLIQRIFSYVMQTHHLLHDVSEAIPYLQRIAVWDGELTREREMNTGRASFSLNDRLEFRNVTFVYGESDWALKGVSFSLAKGAMLGIIGPSGAGKTTVVDLLLRLFTPQEGEILVDGIRAGDIDLYDWRKHIGYVSQDIFLKNDTIAHNIAFYDDGVSRDDIVTAAKTAQCYDFIMRLPQGFDTVVGERGTRLSGGERQRIVLARVLAHKPSILILDEATSAVDNESEAAIRNAVNRIKGELTIIVIAHRLSTVMDVDSLLVVDNGVIVERGKPKDLLGDARSYFHRAYAAGAASY